MVTKTTSDTTCTQKNHHCTCLSNKNATFRPWTSRLCWPKWIRITQRFSIKGPALLFVPNSQEEDILTQTIIAAKPFWAIENTSIHYFRNKKVWNRANGEMSNESMSLMTPLLIPCRTSNWYSLLSRLLQFKIEAKYGGLGIKWNTKGRTETKRNSKISSYLRYSLSTIL